MIKNQIKRRLFAGFIDMFILLMILYFYSVAYNSFTIYTNLPVKGYHILMLIYGYPILQEFIFKTTIGKKIYRIQIDIKKRDFNSFLQIVLRNSINLFEILIPFIYLIPVLVNNKKIGDHFSKIKLIYK